MQWFSIISTFRHEFLSFYQEKKLAKNLDLAESLVLEIILKNGSHPDWNHPVNLRLQIKRVPWWEQNGGKKKIFTFYAKLFFSFCYFKSVFYNLNGCVDFQLPELPSIWTFLSKCVPLDLLNTLCIIPGRDGRFGNRFLHYDLLLFLPQHWNKKQKIVPISCSWLSVAGQRGNYI